MITEGLPERYTGESDPRMAFVASTGSSSRLMVRLTPGVSGMDKIRLAAATGYAGVDWDLGPAKAAGAGATRALFAELKGRGKVQLIAQSETTFSGFYGLGIKFVTDGQGAVTHLLEMRISRDYRFRRTR